MPARPSALWHSVGPVQPAYLATTGAPGAFAWLPVLALITAVGVGAVCAADCLSRSGSTSLAQAVFWLGVVAVFMPTTTRLLGRSAGESERITLIVMLGTALYLVKVMRDPFGYTYADELVHQYNVNHILDTGALFGRNPILPVTPSYPGLEGFTAALASVTGLSSFIAGLIVIGAARVVMTLCLFLLFKAVGGSVQLAALATAMYSATPNYLFFSAQFSYESPALPLATVALLAAVRWWRSTEPDWSPWLLILMSLIPAIAVTHHMTSYAMVGVFLAVSVVAAVGRLGPLHRPLLASVFAAAVVASWLVVVASRTVGYLSPVLGKAITASIGTFAHEQAPRALFTSASGQKAAPWERVLGLGSAGLVSLAQPLGLHSVWRRYRRRSAVAMVMALASLAYVASYGLRLVPAAWETAARASEFLFIGGAFVVAEALIVLQSRAGNGTAVRFVVGALATVTFVGGIVSGTASGLRTAQPYRISVGKAVIVPPNGEAALWLRSHDRTPGPVAAQEADARLVLVYANRDVVAGTYPDIRDVLATPVFYRWQWQLLSRLHVRYIEVDARKASANVSTGYYFPSGAAGSDDRFPETALTKFERAGATRVFDDGDVRIDDLSTVRPSGTTP